MSLDRLPAVTLSGDAYDRGLTHGESFAAEIAANVDQYLDLFEWYGAERETLLEEASEYLSVIDDHNEPYGQEIRGIADGSDVPVEHVTLLNARYEVIYTVYRDKAEQHADSERLGTDGCTSFGVRPDVTADGKTYIGENWDWLEGVGDQMVVTRVEKPDGPNHVGITEAGIVGEKMGVSEAGIGLVVNGLITPEDGETPYRKPFHVRCREVLSSSRFDQALGAVLETDRTCSGNFLLGHHEGELIDVETAPETANYLYPEDGILTHANHFEERQTVESELERLIPHSLIRGPRLRRLLETNRGSLDVSALKTALRDHFDKPASICHHPDPNVTPLRCEQTNVSVIIDLEERSFLATAGPPCEHSYETYRCP